MKRLILLALFALTACSTQIVDMGTEPTLQKYDLSDKEGDGVIAARDQCPASADGALVNNDGCGTESIETIRRNLEVNFEHDSFVVQVEYFAEIERLADFMKEYPQANVTIEGHTSILGSAAYNQVLSENRAMAIKTILSEEFDIAPERVTAVGYGFDQLIAEGMDEESHARNRRIVAELAIDKSYADLKWNIYSVDSVE